MSKYRPKNKPKGKPGRPPKHGGYSLMVRAGTLPERRTYLRAYLQEARGGLVRDLGPEERDLSAAQVILIDRVISKLSIVRCVEESVRETGVFTKRGMLITVLAKSYLSWANSIRLDLQALGIDKRAADKVLDLEQYIAEKDKATGAAGQGTGAPGRIDGQGEKTPGGEAKAEINKEGDPIPPPHGGRGKKPATSPWTRRGGGE